MAHFTTQEIEEIRQRLASRAVKDSQFPTANAVTMEDFVAIVQNGVNKKVTIDSLYDDVSDYLYENYIVLLDIKVKNGSNILKKDASADLEAVVKIGDRDVTSQIPPSHFSWTRSSNNETLDRVWNQLHEGVGNEIHVDAADVNKSCTFYCGVPMESLKNII